jgi:hypothetical protein
MEEAVIQ